MKFNNHKYTYTKPFGSPRHRWELIGNKCGIHYEVCLFKDYPPTAGLEFHYFEPPDYMKDYAPSHIDCFITGGKCWHDGTSLYAIENLWPLIEPCFKAGDHDSIFKILENEYLDKFRDEITQQMKTEE